jgi:glycosyltransferase involved in cell wall biosynthesis
MTTQSPRVSICLPVYNGEKYLRGAIESVLNQTFEDFELIVSDNASNDRTSDICREAASRDARIVYARSAVNDGLARNHNRAFELSRGRYVMWIAHDDELARDYVDRCCKVLEQDPGVVLCYANSTDIDAGGRVTGTVEMDVFGVSDDVSERFKDAVRFESRGDPVYGLMRREVLARTRLHGRFDCSEWVLIAEMALRGRFAHIPDFLFHRRRHPSQASRADRFERQKHMAFEPGQDRRYVFPLFRLASGYLAAIWRARLPLHDSVRCYRYLLGWLDDTKRLFIDDVAHNLRLALQDSLPDVLFIRLLSIKRHLFKRSWTG